MLLSPDHTVYIQQSSLCLLFSITSFKGTLKAGDSSKDSVSRFREKKSGHFKHYDTIFIVRLIWLDPVLPHSLLSSILTDDHKQAVHVEIEKLLIVHHCMSRSISSTRYHNYLANRQHKAAK